MSIDIDAIEARANAATPGVWIQYKKYRTERYVCGAGDKSVAYIIPNDDERSTADGDLFFIAAARSDVPALCAEVRELRGAIAAQDKRIETAGLRVGLFYGTDTPEYMADSIEELRAALGRLQGEVETIINIYPHDPNCSITVGACNCWQAWLERALAGETK